MTKLLQIFLTLLLSVGAAGAAEFYVSPGGSGSTCSDAVPCAPSYAAGVAVAGDTILFKDGTYSLTSSNYITPALYPANSGTAENPITFRSLNPYGAVLTKGGTGPLIGTPYSSQKNYIRFENFDIRGAGCMANTTGTRFTGNKFSIGGVSGGGTTFGCELFAQLTYSCLVRNNWFGNNTNVLDTINDAPIIWYEDSGSVIELNTFENIDNASDENKVGIFLKDATGFDGNPTVVRFNFLVDACIYTPVQNAGDDRSNICIDIYQNVLVGARAYVVYRAYHDRLRVWNNTFYDTHRGVLIYDAGSMKAQNEYFNNIVHATTANMRAWNDAGLGVWSLWDYNRYAGVETWDLTGTDYLSLSAWQGSGYGADAHSSGDTLTFVNPSGSSPEDFKVVGGAPTGGRGGSYSIYLGAYITGDETIGFTEVTGGEPPEDTTDPTLTIMVPGDDPHDNGSDATADLSGTASDNVGVTAVTWTCPQCPVTSGTAIGTTSWSIIDVALSSGTNQFTITAHDAAGNTGAQTIGIIHTPSVSNSPRISAGGGARIGHSATAARVSGGN